MLLLSYQILVANEQIKFVIFLSKVYFHFCINYTASGVGCGASFDAFTSDVGCEGNISSFGSTIETESGRGFLGPILPWGSYGSIIFTLIPSTPETKEQFKSRAKIVSALGVR